MKAMKTGLVIGLALASSTLAVALPAFRTEFLKYYNISPSSPLGKANCSVCHVGATTRLNPYGADLKAAIAKAGAGMKLTPEILKSVENKDSDKDGINNITEIRNGTLPGDPHSPKGK